MSIRYGLPAAAEEALVRRVAEAGMTERQHLPVGLVRVREEVDNSQAVLPIVPTPCGGAAKVTCAKARRWNV